MIESLKVLVDGIARTFGSRCEVVLHDLRNFRNLHRSIVKISNGYVTGRTVGGAITDQGLAFLKSGREENLLLNYSSVTKDGSPLKSSTIVFRNEKKKPIASICINFDVTDIVNFNRVMQDIFRVSVGENAQKGAAETFQGDPVSTLNRIAHETIIKAGKAPPSMERKDKIEIVRQLEDQGFFLIKGAIKLIATKLNVSKFTIYNYLEQIRAKNQESNSLEK